MTHTMTKHRTNPAVRYRYYRCTNAIKNGASECPAGTIPAAEIEQMVVDELRGLGSDSELLGRVLAAAHGAIEGERAALEEERAGLQRSVRRSHRELQKLIADGSAAGEVASRIAELHDHASVGERRLAEIDARLAGLAAESIAPDHAAAALAAFDPVWANLIPREQARLIQLLVEVAEYDALNSSLSVTFRPTSIRAFMDQLQEAAA